MRKVKSGKEKKQIKISNIEHKVNIAKLKMKFDSELNYKNKILI